MVKTTKECLKYYFFVVKNGKNSFTIGEAWFKKQKKIV